MTTYRRCERCDAFIWTPNDVCLCRPFVYRLEADTDPNHWDTAYGFNIETVAEEVVENQWNSDPYDPSRVDEVVIFKDDHGVEARYRVSAEATVNFSSKEDK